MRFVADDELVRLTADRVDVSCEPRVRLDRQRVVAQRLLARLDRRSESTGVALGREVVRELRDEQPPVREDQDAERARCLDEAGRCNRLSRRGRVAEAVAAHSAEIVFRAEQLLVVFIRVALRVGDESVVLVLVHVVVLVLGERMTVAVGKRVVVALHGGDQLGKHPGECVDLVAAQRCSGGSVRLRVDQNALEAEHQPVAHLPLRARRRAAGLDLRGRVVERAAPRSSGREHDRGIFTVPKECFARPRFRVEGCGGQRVRRQKNRRLLSRFLHVRSTLDVLQGVREERGREFP